MARIFVDTNVLFPFSVMDLLLALSEDGIHFAKHPGNPVIPQPPEGHGYPEFRDPFVWREGESYYLIIGSAITGKGGKRTERFSVDRKIGTTVHLESRDHRKCLLGHRVHDTTALR